jgi:hypothetical protein
VHIIHSLVYIFVPATGERVRAETLRPQATTLPLAQMACVVDDEVEITGGVYCVPRLGRSEDAHLQNARDACCGPISLKFEGCIVVAQQKSDTCLVHAMINAMQNHVFLDQLLEAVYAVARADACDRRDIRVGTVALKRVCGLGLHNGFDEHADAHGIMHMYNHGDGQDHFVAIRRIGNGLYMLDSLDGACVQIFDMPQLARRCSLYHLK